MLAKLRSNLTFANVASGLALFVALSTGGAYAAHETIFSDDIVDGQVQNPDLGADSVSTAKIQTQGVANSDIAPNAITATRLAEGSVGTSEIETGNVFNADIASNTITSSRIADSTLTDLDLAPSSVGGSEIATGAVGFGKIANSAVTSGTVLNNNLFHGDIDDLHRAVETITDSSNGGSPVTVELDTVGNSSDFQMAGSCNRTGASGENLTGQVTIEANSTTTNWSVDTDAPGGSNNQTNLGANETRTLIGVGPVSSNQFHTGDFSARADPTTGPHVHGLVSVEITPGSQQCTFGYTRLGGDEGA